MRKSKIISLEDAVKRFITPGTVLAVGGMHMHNNPMALVREIVRQNIRVKTLITSPSACINADLLVGAGLVEEVISSYIGLEHLGLAPNFRRAAEQKKLKIREVDESFLIFGFRAGAAAVPFTPLPKGLEITDIPKVNPEDYKVTRDPFTGEDVLCARALQPDVAVIHCQKSDPYGNAVFEGARFTDFDMLKACSKVILQVEVIVPHEEFMKEKICCTVPSMLVDCVVQVPFGCHPTASHRYYTYDEQHLLEYLKLCKESAQPYLEKYVLGPKNHDEYIALIGGEPRLALLREGGKVW
jgi:glutaconate CoA-transferase subunit A